MIFRLGKPEALVVYFVILVVNVIKSDSQHNSKNCYRKKLENSEHWKLPCLCPNETFSGYYLKSLCPDIKTLNHVQLYPGDNVTIECQVFKELGPVYQHYRIRMWWCNETVGGKCYTSQQGPDRTPRTYFTYSQSGYNDDEWKLSFTITNASKRHENTYTCVTNTEDEDYTRTPGYSSIRVSVRDKEKPKLTKQPPSSVRTAEGRLVELYCDSQGYPYTKIRWLRDGTPLNTSGEVENGKQSLLRLHRITHSDRGFYQCIAYNEVGHIASGGTTIEIKTEKTMVEIFKSTVYCFIFGTLFCTIFCVCCVCLYETDKMKVISCHGYRPI